MAKSNDKRAARAGAVRNVLRGTFEGLLLVALASAAVLGVNALRSPETSPIKRVEVLGELRHLQPAVMRERIAAHASAGFFTVDLDAIERALEELPWVYSAAVRRKWPETLAITVREQTPIARWGDEGLLNARGEIFAPPVAQRPQELPVLFGPPGRERELIRYYQQASQTLAPLGLGIHALVEDERRAWHVLLSNGTPVALGRGDPLSRVALLSRVYPWVLADKRAQVASVDLRYTNGFSVAWKPSITSPHFSPGGPDQ